MMKTQLLILLLLSKLSVGQQTIYDTIVHDGLKRSLILYIPVSYSASKAAPLLFNFHGYTSNNTEQMAYGDFRPIADTAGFIIVHPMGTIDTLGNTYWNSNWGGTVDDIGFTAALIDSIAKEYNIDFDRVFSTGMSNGGFMSYTLACELSNKIAAIASVTGTMNYNQIANCTPQRPIPVMEIHGTADATVPYGGVPLSMESVAKTQNYWVTYNKCNATAIKSDVPDINIVDGCSAEHHVYQNGDNGVEVELYKIIGGGHTWPGAQYIIGVTNYDIDASLKIWEFFSKYDINGRISVSTSIHDQKTDVAAIEIFPNPVSDKFSINYNSKKVNSIRILNSKGKEITTVNLNQSNSNTFTVRNWQKGLYFVIVEYNDQLVAVSKLIIIE